MEKRVRLLRYGLLIDPQRDTWSTKGMDIKVKLLDPYHMKGKEKTEYLSRLGYIIDSEVISKETQYEALGLLEQEAQRRISHLKSMLIGFEAKKKDMTLKALEEYKVMCKVRFVAKWEKEVESGKYTKEMLSDMEELDAAETHGCYTFQGLKVQRKSCKMCSKRHSCVGGA